MNLFEYITSLAPEGTTVLFLRQTKTGACVPYLPEQAQIRKGEAWFGNIGLYLPDRFTDGPKAQSRMIEQVWALMLDDIGTKVTTPPPLEPTWKVESSPGNQQWVYVFKVDHMPGKAEFNAALKAIADAGYTDPGASNPVRNFRIPGSWNTRKQFEAKLVELHEDREFTLAEICQAFGVTPGESSGETTFLDVKDDGQDTVLAWLHESGLVLDGVNGAGWCSVVCPNHEQHSNDDAAGRYFPAARAYKCMHGHCVDWDSQRFLTWVAEQGGPQEGYGIRDELLTAQISGSLSKLTPTDAFPDEAAKIIAEVERKELSRLDRSEWPARFAYVLSDDAYFDLVERRLYSRANFNAIFRHVTCRSIHNNRHILASYSFDELRSQTNAKVAVSQTYSPGDTELVTRDGDVYVNRWRDMRLTGSRVDPTPWLNLTDRLFTHPVERDHLLDMVAFKYQNPDVKINHGALIIGGPGIGKDSWAKAVSAAIGNSTTLRDHEVISPWGYSLETEMLILNELRQGEVRDRRAVENFLKPLLAAPPEYLMVNMKGLHPYPVVNRLFVLAFSNFDVPIALPGDDRRWFVVKSSAEPFEGRALWDWYAKGGLDAVAGFLARRDVSAFDPGMPAPMTDAKRTLIEAGLSATESSLVEQILAQVGPFAGGVVGGPWQRVCDVLTQPGQPQVYVGTLLHSLREAGWIDRGRCHSRRYPSNRAIWCAPKLKGEAKARLRDLVEESRAGGLTLVSGKS
jgi:hypothetical protein